MTYLKIRRLLGASCFISFFLPHFAAAQEEVDAGTEGSAVSGLQMTASMASVKKDLASAQQRLNAQREAIASEKPKLSAVFEKARAELLEKRRKARIARMAKVDRDAMLKGLEQKHYVAGKDYAFVDGQLKDYGLMFETFLLPGEEKIYQSAMGGVRDLDGSFAERMKKRLLVLEAGVSRLELMLGGGVVEGEAVAADGEVKAGRFALAGPAMWFSSIDGKLVGAVMREKASQSPKVRQGEEEGVQSLLAGQQATMKIDVTGGKAQALASLEADKLDIFRKGGFWIWPILGIALFSAISGVVKLMQIIRIRTPHGHWVAGILSALREGDADEAKSQAAGVVHPVSDVVGYCLDYIKAGPDVVEEVLYERLIGVQNKLQAGLPLIAITAATAPLLGLLGTVAGMIRTFNVITVSGTGDAKPLAGGISEALITTLFGLVVAIPALIIHALLSRRCQGIIQNTEKLGLTLVNGLRGESALKARPNESP